MNFSIFIKIESSRGVAFSSIAQMSLESAFGFSNDLYVSSMTEDLRARCALENSTLYLEVGGHLLFDSHASRVLPGFNPACKTLMLSSFPWKKTAIVCCAALLAEADDLIANSKLRYRAAVRRKSCVLVFF